MNIYVGNLPYQVNEEDLRKAFEAFGTVESVKVITDMGTGRSKGFGFVEMSNDSEGQSAIEAMDGKELKGRAIKVSKAKPPRGGGGGGGGRGGGRSGGRRGGGWQSY
jgi:RNA recognition motif-containing protein